MGSDQLSTVMSTIGERDASKRDALKAQIERESTALYTSARIMDECADSLRCPADSTAASSRRRKRATLSVSASLSLRASATSSLRARINGACIGCSACKVYSASTNRGDRRQNGEACDQDCDRAS